jgi:hypothetical protein
MTSGSIDLSSWDALYMYRDIKDKVVNTHIAS